MKTKNILVALALSLGLLVVSCTDDSNAGETLAPLESSVQDTNERETINLFDLSLQDTEGLETLVPLAGKWNLFKVGKTVGDQETLIDAPQNQSGCDQDYLNLAIDGTVVDGDYDSSISPCTLKTNAGTYFRSNNNLTLVINNVTTTLDIKNLTFVELKLKDAFGIIKVYIR